MAVTAYQMDGLIPVRPARTRGYNRAQNLANKFAETEYGYKGRSNAARQRDLDTQMLGIDMSSNRQKHAPANWAAMYFAPSLESIRLVAMKPIVTAGLMCAPEIFIVAETMTERMIPCATATVNRSPPETQMAPAPMNVKANVAIPSAYNLASVSLHI